MIDCLRAGEVLALFPEGTTGDGRALWRTLCTRDLKAIVEFGTPELAQGRDRRVWATDLQQQIEKMRG